MSSEGPRFHRQSQVYEFAAVNDPHLSQTLSHEAAWATELLGRLTTTGGDDGMKPGVLNACEGLAFIKTHKGGLGLTWAKGHGFVTRKLEQDRFGHSRWSPPVFFGVSQFGVGISAGYESVESCLALMNLHSVHKFAHEKAEIGTDLLLFSTDGGMSGMPAGTFGRMSHMDVTADNQNTCFAYSTSSGVLVNLSINGTELKPNTDLNHKLYGDMDMEQVLAGKAHTYNEFVPLYRKISELASKAIA